MENGIALLKQRIEKTRKENEVVKNLPVGEVRPWSDQPRKFISKESIENLAASIKQVGQPGCFTIDDGERRWRACQLLRRLTIRAIVVHQENDDDRFVTKSL